MSIHPDFDPSEVTEFFEHGDIGTVSSGDSDGALEVRPFAALRFDSAGTAVLHLFTIQQFRFTKPKLHIEGSS